MRSDVDRHSDREIENKSSKWTFVQWRFSDVNGSFMRSYLYMKSICRSISFSFSLLGEISVIFLTQTIGISWSWSHPSDSITVTPIKLAVGVCLSELHRVQISRPMQIESDTERMTKRMKSMLSDNDFSILWFEIDRLILKIYVNLFTVIG